MNRGVQYVVAAAIFGLSLATPHSAHAEVYAEVVQGCKTLGGKCASLRLGPGTEYARIKSARIGTVLEIDGQVEANGYLWYRIKKDSAIRYPERARGTWYIASHLVRLHENGGEEYAQTARRTGKYIVVDISDQRLYAYGLDTTGVYRLFMSAPASTGIKGTPTPKGTFFVKKKQPSRYMQGPLPGISGDVYDLPGVPWNLYFTNQGGAIHGAYWHTAFGTRHSHGCVNLPVHTAKTLYDWADAGTPVYVRS